MNEYVQYNIVFMYISFYISCALW